MKYSVRGMSMRHVKTPQIREIDIDKKRIYERSCHQKRKRGGETIKYQFIFHFLFKFTYNETSFDRKALG